MNNQNYRRPSVLGKVNAKSATMAYAHDPVNDDKHQKTPAHLRGSLGGPPMSSRHSETGAFKYPSSRMTQKMQSRYSKINYVDP